MSDKPKRAYKRKSLDEKLAEIEVLRSRLLAQKATENMADHPVMSRIINHRQQLEDRSRIDTNLVHGYGKGRTAADRIRALRAEADDLQKRLERAVEFLPGVEDMIAGLDALQAATMDGKFDGNDAEKPDFSFLTEEYKSWKETPMEHTARLEREARADKRDQSKTATAGSTPSSTSNEAHPITDGDTPAESTPETAEV